MYRILMVEDDAAISAILNQELEKWGYHVDVAKDFAHVMETFLETKPQLVLLDLNLPFRSGFYWCAQIREVSSVPIVFLSSAGDEMNLVTAIHQGADDFIAKPFDFAILVAKMQAVLRRTYDFSPPQNHLSHKGAVLDLGDVSLRVCGEKVPLSGNEFRILQALLENKGRVVSRTALIRRLWEEERFIDDNTLTVNVARLRRKLEEAGLHDFICTKKGVGYLVGE